MRRPRPARARGMDHPTREAVGPHHERVSGGAHPDYTANRQCGMCGGEDTTRRAHAGWKAERYCRVRLYRSRLAGGVLACRVCGVCVCVDRDSLCTECMLRSHLCKSHVELLHNVLKQNIPGIKGFHFEGHILENLG